MSDRRDGHHDFLVGRLRAYMSNPRGVPAEDMREALRAAADWADTLQVDLKGHEREAKP